MTRLAPTIATGGRWFELYMRETADDSQDQRQLDLPVEEPKETRIYLHDGIVRELAATADEWAYYELEARKRGISIVEMYDIEDEAGMEYEKLGVTEEFLDFVMANAQPPQNVGS